MAKTSASLWREIAGDETLYSGSFFADDFDHIFASPDPLLGASTDPVGLVQELRSLPPIPDSDAADPNTTGLGASTSIGLESLFGSQPSDAGVPPQAAMREFVA